LSVMQALHVGRRRLRTARRVWARLILILWMRRGRQLPGLVDQLARPRQTTPPNDPTRQGLAVYTLLGVGRMRARCLTMSLVHFSLLVDQGFQPELVIGLPPRPINPDAHAWVEIDGVDVGPPPGMMGAEELARFPRRSA
jgi:Transglutaminase-like superfamily